MTDTAIAAARTESAAKSVDEVLPSSRRSASSTCW
jgi:hypothetical protein